MKKISFVIITLVLVLVLLVVEIVIVKKASSYEPEVLIVFAKQKIPAKSIISEEMLVVKKVQIGLAHRLSFKEAKGLLGKKSRVEIEEGEMILSSKLGEAHELEVISVLDPNNRLFSIELKADQANGWRFMTDQYVDILYVPNEKSKLQTTANSISKGMDIKESEQGSLVQRLENIRVAALVDEKGNLVKNEDRATLPKYVSLEVNTVQDEILAYAKGNGRLEISVIPLK